MNFTHDRIKERRFAVLAKLIFDHWEEGSGMDTRYFDHPFIHDDFVVNGQSTKGGSYREHVVPRAYLRDRCQELYANGRSIEDVGRLLMDNLRIVLITLTEAETLNERYKTTMPPGWTLGESDPLARLREVGIDVV